MESTELYTRWLVSPRGEYDEANGRQYYTQPSGGSGSGGSNIIVLVIIIILVMTMIRRGGGGGGGGYGGGGWNWFPSFGLQAVVGAEAIATVVAGVEAPVAALAAVVLVVAASEDLVAETLAVAVPMEVGRFSCLSGLVRSHTHPYLHIPPLSRQPIITNPPSREPDRGIAVDQKTVGQPHVPLGKYSWMPCIT